MVFNKAQFMQLLAKLMVSPYETYEIFPSDQDQVTLYMRSGEIERDGLRLSVAANLHFADYLHLTEDDLPGPILADIEIVYWSDRWHCWVPCLSRDDVTREDALSSEEVERYITAALGRAKQAERGE